jgi:hypothetical protein
VSDNTFHEPSELERAFLRIVTRGYPAFEQQIDACEVSTYDPAGWLRVRVPKGLPGYFCAPGDGPILEGPWPTPRVDIMLWTDKSGLLEDVEVIEYGDPLPDVLTAFVDAARSQKLSYRAPSL